MNKYVVFGCLAAVVIAVVCAACGAVAFWYLGIRELPNLGSELSMPAEVPVGEAFELRVSLSNPHDEPVTLDSIDIDDGFLEGFQVLSIEPEATGTFHMPILNQRSWSFDKQLSPGQRLVVTFHLSPVNAGHYSGNIEVCNPNQDCRSMLGDVVVQPGQ